ncbi:hypothetical protein FRX31_015987 [Thalictrum thalictroides]|uniref:GRF-type domain-containing protein n=1 Tax=Thalictrum thalictroides TaxID=46969 RepID=A0A7J6WBW8_THATH|nr:hypothetical protein FRX31_015987 [Thalictrum thalictroides]
MSSSSINSSPTCKCGIEDLVKISLTSDNPYRRFYGCCNYPTNNCNYFRWIDPPLNMEKKVEYLKNMNEVLETKNQALEKKNQLLEKQLEKKVEAYEILIAEKLEMEKKLRMCE